MNDSELTRSLHFQLQSSEKDTPAQDLVQGSDPPGAANPLVPGYYHTSGSALGAVDLSNPRLNTLLTSTVLGLGVMVAERRAL